MGISNDQLLAFFTFHFLNERLILRSHSEIPVTAVQVVPVL